MIVAFVFCSVFIYGFSLNKSQDMEYPVVLEISSTARARAETTPEQISASGWEREFVPFILLGLFACGFGAIHCFAWNSPFSTPEERLAWRICSVTTTALPAVGPLIIIAAVEYNGGMVRRFWYLASILMIISYILGRATIVVLAFITLRALPADAFQIVNWSDYLPHFAA